MVFDTLLRLTPGPRPFSAGPVGEGLQQFADSPHRLRPQDLALLRGALGGPGPARALRLGGVP